MSQQDNNQMQQHFYRASAADFGKIPGSPIAYWVHPKINNVFASCEPLKNYVDGRVGLMTSDNDKFLRFFWEITHNSACFTASNDDESISSQKRWFPHNKGGSFRKWAGNYEYVVDWFNRGENIKATVIKKYPYLKGNPNFVVHDDGFYFKPFISWSEITSGGLSFRYFDKGFTSNVKGMSAFPLEDMDFERLLSLLNSKFSAYVSSSINPTVSFGINNLYAIPAAFLDKACIEGIVGSAISITKSDWDSYETSWGFKKSPLLGIDIGTFTLSESYQILLSKWNHSTLEIQHLEEENNRLFIESYGLQDELTPEVPLSEITLTCNPHYRYSNNLTDDEREARLQSDTICELISYAIGCMMGRYSLDREGLVYAHAGNEGFKALVEEGAYATFAADEDGILPLSTDSWFEDDVATRLEGFVRTVWGTETLEENLQFIADSLCLSAIKPVKKGGETSRETLRRYLSTQFYKDHLKTYKKRPIYWLFSSGKEKAFECLVYLHRYNESTLPRMRTEYVTPLLGQMAGRIERLRLQQAEAGTAEAKRIGKDIDSLTKQLTELRAFDDELKHHADMRIHLDLDDGVKVNYGKFGTLLSEVKAITGSNSD